MGRESRREHVSMKELFDKCDRQQRFCFRHPWIAFVLHPSLFTCPREFLALAKELRAYENSLRINIRDRRTTTAIPNSSGELTIGIAPAIGGHAKSQSKRPRETTH